jgi:mRNA interferase MazF
MPYKFGDVVLVRFPFTNQTAAKQRPSVVVSSNTYNASKPDVVIMAITSQLRPAPTLGEVWIDQWQSANLLKPSAIKPVFATLEHGLVIRQLGHLHPQDENALRVGISAVLG